MDMYYGANQFEFPPHIYALAENAHRNMQDHNRDQVIIITGE
jgi:myosin-1